MINIEKIKESLKQRIDNLSENKLNDVSLFLKSLETENNKAKILSFAGIWNNIDDEVFNELTQNLEDRRKNKRTSFF